MRKISVRHNHSRPTRIPQQPGAAGIMGVMIGQVTLRDVVDEDLEIFFEHQQDPEATRMAAFPAREWDAFMDHWNKILADESVYKQTILYDGQIAGNIVSFIRGSEREVGYWIGSGFWGKGIATRALGQFLKMVTARPLYAHAARHNLGSIRVLEKCGFRKIHEGPVPGEEELEEVVLKLE